MPTRVLQMELDELPDELAVGPEYDAAFVLVRWRGHPVGQFTLPAHEGRVHGTRLRDAVIDASVVAVGDRRLVELLGEAERPAVPLPSVAVCTRDRPDDLARCLQALQRVFWDDAQEIVVVDSCSTSAETREVATRAPRVRYVREDRPGLDIARNRALAESRHEIVAFTDDDAMPEPGWLRALVRPFATPRVICSTGLTMPAELETPAQEWFEQTNGFGRGFRPRLFDGIDDDPFAVARIGAGVNMALRRSVPTLVGPFDEALDAGTPTRSGGDHDMFTRILAAGYCIGYEPAAVNWHRHRRTWPELVDTVAGYGTGVYAHLTGHLLRGELGALVVGLGWLRWQLGALVRAPFGQSGRAVRELGMAQLRGSVAGPGALLRSRRRAVARVAVPTPARADA